ncbi:restriction endonuclease subunit S [Vibrio breoganii]
MVPNGWSIKTLENLATVERGKFSARPRNDPKYYGGEIPFVQTGDIASAKTYLSSFSQTLNEDGLKVSRIFPKNSILITIAANIGDTAITSFDVACPDSLVGIQPKQDVDCFWLNSFLETRKDDLDGKATQNAQKNINLQVLKPLEILTPPYEEQRKIANILSTWDKAIATTEKLIETSKQQKKALMQQLLTGKKRLVKPETDKAFQGEWEEVPLSRWLIEFKEKSSVQDQHRVYTSSRSGLLPQDEYFGNSRISDRKNIGFHVLPPEHMTYRSRSDDGFFTFNLFKGKENGIISHYYPVFTSKGSNDFFIALLEQYRSVFGKHSVGTSQKVLSFNALKAIKFSVPSTEEQKKIASVLTSANKEIEVLEAKLSHFKQEKKALMQQLLTGKRRVKVAETEST